MHQESREVFFLFKLNLFYHKKCELKFSLENCVNFQSFPFHEMQKRNKKKSTEIFSISMRVSFQVKLMFNAKFVLKRKLKKCFSALFFYLFLVLVFHSLTRPSFSSLYIPSKKKTQKFPNFFSLSIISRKREKKVERY